MKNTLSYDEQIISQIRKYRKLGNGAAVLYYEQRLGTSNACASWETFKGSWAGENWLKDNLILINATQKNLVSRW